jgi:hypothetical protein
MSDRSQNLHTEPMANADSFDLSELRGLREPIQHVSADSLNLSQASIPSNNIHRASSIANGRSPSLNQVSSRGLLPRSVVRALRPKSGNAQQGARNGIFKNPYYRYHGGIFARIITFLANVLKVLEQLLLRGTRVAAAPKVLVTPPPQPKTNTDKVEKLEEERSLKREQKKKRLLIHRS